MHPILPIYAIFSVMTLMGLNVRQKSERTYLWIAAWGAMSVVLLAIIFRDVRGDTRRYHWAFERMAEQSFAEMAELSDNNLLFDAIHWFLAQFGTHPLLFIVPYALFCIMLMRASLRLMLGQVDTAIAIFLYSAFPFFVFYVSSGLKQALAMAILFHGYVCLFHGRRIHAVFWIGLAPLLHTGALLVYPFVALHYLLWRPYFSQRRVLTFSILGLFICTALSLVGLNEPLMAPFAELTETTRRYAVYFDDADRFNYRAGFRLDFTLFSYLPLFAAWWLMRQGRGLSLENSGWWLNLYVLLACLYQLFAFAPFADRFAAFAWYLIPAILVIMLADSQSIKARQVVVLSFSILNILILQFYTGHGLHFSF